MISGCRGLCGSAVSRDVRCHAKGQGRRGVGPGSSSSSKQQGRKGGSGGSAGGLAAVPKMSAAAKAAAKRANMFSQQRFERAMVGTLEAPSSSSSSSSSSSNSSWRQRLSRAAAASSDDEDDGDTDGAGQADSSSSIDRQLLQQPYLQTVVQQLRQTGALGPTAGGAAAAAAAGDAGNSSSSSSSSGGRGRGAKRGAARSLLEAHSAVFQAALDLELQEEWGEAEQRLQSWPVSRLSAEGVALFGLAAAPAGGMYRDVLLKFFLPNRALPFHSFSQGDILLVSQGDPLEDSHESVVVDFSSRWIRLALNPTAAAAVSAAGRGAAWRLDLFANTVSHERCSEALKRFAAGVGGGQADAAAAGGLAGQSVTQQQEALWRVLAGVIPPGQTLAAAAAQTPPWIGQTLAAAAAQTPPWIRSPQGRDRLASTRARVKSLVAAGRINQSQAKAVEAALTRTCTLWQGPPGTGKTTTLLHFCEAALRLLAASGGQILAVAASNVAVDNLVAGLLQLGVKVVRLGQPVKVAPALRSVTLEVLAAATPAGQEAARLRQQLVAAAAAAAAGARGSSSGSRRASGGGAKRSSGSSSSSTSGGQGLWEQMLALEAAAAAEVLGRAQVVAATCVGAGDPIIAERGFELVVLDEATQAPEPAALVAVAARAQALVMVGDPKQLPPTVKCREAEKLGLGLSMFDRLQAMGLPPLLLDVQYRMHPALCDFPSQQFYGGLLRSWPQPQDRPLPGGIAWPNPEVPVMFIQCNGPESRTQASMGISRQREAGASTDSEDEPAGQRGSNSNSSSSSVAGGGGGGFSFFNAAEAAVVVGCLEQLLLQGGLASADVCVITPYSGQVRAIQQLLPRYAVGSASGSDGPDKAGRTRSGNRNGSNSSSSSSSSSSSGSSSSSSTKLTGGLLADLEVKSVDGFQGREKEVVIFSAVRSNASRRVGFLSDARRLNVAITRAKRGLVVVGDARTLAADGVWAVWLKWAAQQGVVAQSAVTAEVLLPGR
uniref:AAA+ ATPase domain-containing protein n=1 Tax=Tetradesmus obliquus TaxID=3088 RepID=A0A383VFK2_TETOB